MNNPMEDPPGEVCAEGNQAIWTYFKTKRNMKIMATKVTSAKILDSTQLLWRGVNVKYITNYSGAALYTSIPCPHRE